MMRPMEIEVNGAGVKVNKILNNLVQPPQQLKPKHDQP
jgi:hypothetical protein